MDKNFITRAKEKIGFFLRRTSKGKEYYQAEWQKFWDECIIKAENELNELGLVPSEDSINETAAEISEESADVAQIVGYYIVYHKEDALRDWKMNTEGMEFSEEDREITRILEKLYP